MSHSIIFFQWKENDVKSSASSEGKNKVLTFTASVKGSKLKVKQQHFLTLAELDASDCC